MKKKRNEITNNELAQKIDTIKADLSSQIDDLKVGLNEKIADSVDELAGMTKRGFDNMQMVMEHNHTELKTHVNGLETDVDDIKPRLGYHAPQFEVDDLKKRVTRLEKKTGIA